MAEIQYFTINTVKLPNIPFKVLNKDKNYDLMLIIFVINIKIHSKR